MAFFAQGVSQEVLDDLATLHDLELRVSAWPDNTVTIDDGDTVWLEFYLGEGE